MKALVTGGAGFIGSHLVDALLRLNYEVVVLDSLEERVHGKSPNPALPRGVQLIRDDVRNKKAWEKALAGVEVVFHQAAYQDYMPDYSAFFHTNVVGTSLLFEVIRQRHLKIRKVVVASSQAVYGEGQYQCPVHGLVLPIGRPQQQMHRGDWEVHCGQCGETLTPSLLREEFPNPCNQYALSKFAQEMTALRLGRSLGVPTVALRYSITQGPRQSLLNQYSGILRIFLWRIKAGEPVFIYEDGRQTRDFVHVQDVVDANLLVLSSDAANYEAYNVGSGRRTTVLDYAHQLADKLELAADFRVPGEFREGDNRHSVSSIEKLRTLGWSPCRDLGCIMDDFVDWIDEIGALPAQIPDAVALMRAGGVIQKVTVAEQTLSK
jgi:dTDP-L-rhamnose 4-epimerase